MIGRKLWDYISKRFSSARGGKERESLSDFCYDMAYFFLPRLLFSNLQQGLKCFLELKVPAGPSLYTLACGGMGRKPDPEVASKFQMHIGDLDADTSYFVLEYPTLPPYDPDTPGSTLAPYFSAILHFTDPNSKTSRVRYHTLGQSPSGGTTLRQVFPDGANANMGKGPRPELLLFLEALRQSQPTFAVTRPPRP